MIPLPISAAPTGLGKNLILVLQTAEEYLTDADENGEVTDAESVVTEKSNTESELSSNYGKLKHSDSLLLLTQVRRKTNQSLPNLISNPNGTI